MRFLWRIAMLCVLSAGLAWTIPAWAADQAPKGAATAVKPPADLKPGQYFLDGKVLEGDAVCMHCHDEQEQKPILSIVKSRHFVKADKRTGGCQGCHGTSDKHMHNAEAGKDRTKPDVVYGPKSATPAAVQTETCLNCHQGGKRMHWAGSQHEGQDLTCVSCHSMHAEDKVLEKTTQREVCFKCHKTEQAQTHRISTHPLDAGKMSCSDCHNPHGSVGPKLLVKNTVTETCYTCHADKRGPFLWEHPPVAEDCTNCHTPHGSNITPLLKNRSPLLCVECHGANHGVSSGGFTGSKLAAGLGNTTGTNATPPQLFLHGCANCHSQVHGSNHPSGQFYQR